MTFDINNFLTGLEGPAKRRALAAGVRAVDQFAERVIGKAKTITPYKTGALTDSDVAEPAQLKGKNITAVVGFNTDCASTFVIRRFSLLKDLTIGIQPLRNTVFMP